MRQVGELIGDKRGQALVELALVLPLLIILLMGTMEFGRIFHSYLLITNASREGARAGITSQTDSEIITKVKDVAATLNLTDAQITITPNQSARTRGVPLTVKVDYSVNLITPVLDTIIPNPFPLSATTVMRME
ncbi:pilus assembly protein [Pelotomaculum isophthalicicum JI]|uniref:Pilus assembly protein n=1 Tax=Pelotomaculum isophthalicicum JI TaxID=947010 RepID=A0A9X4JV58_9FIRM|nr:TadE family protein [Pelotomaculum isophthalicicum]MDF9406928.1 pilus assembly protein [Pelotomaculum isophthalicicum JI]